MSSTDRYGSYETAWCPGCGNHAILKAVKKGLDRLDLAPHQVLFVSGVGQAAKAPHYLDCNFFNGLHGRALPPATGAKLANPDLCVIAESGDGCSYGEGGNHFLAAIRRNIDITLIAHDNQIYGLTKGQASPTTMQGQKTKAQPLGAPSVPFNPLAVGAAMKIGFAARGFSGDVEHLSDLIVQAVRHKGFSLVDVLQPCVSFNKVNTFAWYKERIRVLGPEHDPTNWSRAMDAAMRFGDEIPVGVIYKNDRPPFGAKQANLSGPLARREFNPEGFKTVVESYA